jgi:predicted nucleotidyltransferase component of viral defense system
MGINMRTTMDIDVNITGMNFEKDALVEMISNIIAINLEDDVFFEIDKTAPIKEDNEYGGYKFKLIAKLSNIKVPFSVDISTGDLITPKAIEYTYKTILEKEDISLYTYNYETIIAEKLETILKRNTANSRMKDYYDLYYFVNYKWNEIDIETLKLAIETTFKHRNSEKYLNDYNTIITNIQNEQLLITRWNNYKKEHEYAKQIEFEDTISAINSLYKICT